MRGWLESEVRDLNGLGFDTFSLLCESTSPPHTYARKHYYYLIRKLLQIHAFAVFFKRCIGQEYSNSVMVDLKK